MAAPTERQLAWAMSLGVELYAGLDRESLSGLIDEAMQTMEDEQPSRWQLLVGEEWGEEVDDEYETRGDFASRLFEVWQDSPEVCDVPNEIEQRLMGGRNSPRTAAGSRATRRPPTPEERESARRLAAQQAEARREQRQKIIAATKRATITTFQIVARQSQNALRQANRIPTALAGDDTFMLRLFQVLFGAGALLIIAVLFYIAFGLVGP